MIKSKDDLNNIVHDCTTAFDDKLAGKNGMRAIVLCGGTGCLSSNSADILLVMMAILNILYNYLYTIFRMSFI